MRESQNPIEKEGIRRAWETINQADVIIYLVDCRKGLTSADQQIIDELASDNLQLVFSKCDLAVTDNNRDPAALYISTLEGTGMDLLIERITGHISDYNQDNQTFMARRRHVEALLRAQECVLQSAHTFNTTRSGELMAEDLRGAQRFLDEITGEFTSDDLLGKIFSSFCVGK